jgi:site-specific DNA-cytosine methylase
VADSLRRRAIIGLRRPRWMYRQVGNAVPPPAAKLYVTDVVQ